MTKAGKFHCVEREFVSIERFEIAMNESYIPLGWKLLSLTRVNRSWGKPFYLAILTQQEAQ